MIDLKRYVKRRVILQLKQPYQYQLARSEGGKPVPFALSKTDRGYVPARKDDFEAVPLVVTTIVGVVLERGGGYVLEMADETSKQGHMIEVEVTPELVGFVSVVREDSILISR